MIWWWKQQWKKEMKNGRRKFASQKCNFLGELLHTTKTNIYCNCSFNTRFIHRHPEKKSSETQSRAEDWGDGGERRNYVSKWCNQFYFLDAWLHMWMHNIFPIAAAECSIIWHIHNLFISLDAVVRCSIDDVDLINFLLILLSLTLRSSWFVFCVAFKNEF